MRMLYRPLLVFLTAGLVLTGCDSGSTVPDDLGNDTTIQFQGTSATIGEEEGTYILQIEAQDPGFKELTGQVSFDESACTLPADEVNAASSFTFPKAITSGGTIDVEITITDDDRIDEGPEAAVFTLSAGSGVSLGEATQFTLTLEDDEPAIDIIDARQTVQTDESQREAVRIKGTVTRAFGSYARLQDDSGPSGASGIVIRATGDSNVENAFRDAISSGDIRSGTVLALRGTASAFSGLVQFNEDDLEVFQIRSQGTSPSPQTIPLDSLGDSVGEKYESELVRIEGLTFPFDSGTFEAGENYTVEGADGTRSTFRVQDNDESALSGEPIPTGAFDYEGVVGQFNFGFGGADEPDEGYQLIPVQTSDVQTRN